MSCVKEMLGLTWRDTVTHTEMLSRTRLETIEGILTRARLRWSGHVYRMPDNRLPDKVLYGQLSEGTRLPQGPKKRYKDQLKQSPRNFNLDPDKFEEDTLDQTKWRSALKPPVIPKERCADSRDTHPAKSPHRRMAHSPSAWSAVQCHGLFSHRRTHRPETSGRGGSQVIIVSDGLQ